MATHSFTKYNKLMQKYPNNVVGRHKQAVALIREGKLDEAEELYIGLLIEEPSFISAYNNLGIIARNRGNLEKAKEYYQKTLQLNPRYFQGLGNLGNIFRMQGKFEEAEKYYKKAIAIEPNFADAHNSLGATLQTLGRMEEAAESYEKAIKINPSYTDAYGNLGGVLIELGRMEEAELCLRAVEKTSESYEPIYNLANLLKEKGEFREAAALYRKVIKKERNFADAYNGLLNCLKYLCLWQEADKVYAELQALSEKALLEGQRTGETPFTAITTSDDPVWNLKVALSWGKVIGAVFNKPTGFYFDRKRKTHRKLRIGYLSKDFIDHPVGHIIKGMFAAHDRRKFEIYCFSHAGKSEDRFKKKIQKAVKYFVDISSMSIDDAAQRIHAEEIDILVDLMGHTAGNRLGIMAIRPSPIQISYLGFPGSLGADFIDYQIVDRVLVPKGMEKYYKEKLIFMPDCYQVNDSAQKISRKNFKRSDFGLPEDAFVFASFNRTYKITPLIFGSWMRILKAVPNAVLWLLFENAETEKTLKKEAKKRSVNPKRLIFSKNIPLEQHLKRLPLADLMLDTQVYSGGATTTHSLRMGVPVITYAGKTYLSRMSAALLTTVGMDNLITKNLENYEKLAKDLAQNPQKLRRIKAKLTKNLSKSAIFDTREFVRNLEIAYGIIWKFYQTGRKPYSIELKRFISRKPE